MATDGVAAVAFAILALMMPVGIVLRAAGSGDPRHRIFQTLSGLAALAVATLTYWCVGRDVLGSFADIASGPGALILGIAMSTAAACIVSAAVAGRTRLWPGLGFVLLFTAILFPIAASLALEGGFFERLGFIDRAGATIVHGIGGWAALIGAVIVGVRSDWHQDGGYASASPELSAAGALLMVFGALGLNATSLLVAGIPISAFLLGSVALNTLIAAMAGLLAALAVTQVLLKRPLFEGALGGAIAGLAAIAAEPLAAQPWQAMLIGALAGLIAVFARRFFRRLRIDDSSGALPDHLFPGIFGTLVVPLVGPSAHFAVQAGAVAAIGALVSISALLFFLALKLTVGLRVSASDEDEGLDRAVLGVES